MPTGSLAANSQVGIGAEGGQLAWWAGSTSFRNLLSSDQSLACACLDTFSCPSLSSVCCMV